MTQRRIASSAAILIVVNVMPLFGVLLLDWDVFRILSLFWLENVFIGFFAIARIVATGAHRQYRGGLFIPLFFVVHYGGFMAGHAFVLIALFGSQGLVPGQLESPGYYVDLLARADLAIMALGLFVSHAWSFVRNFIGAGEYGRIGAGAAMALPYRRMMITHVALLVGGFLLQERGQPAAGLAILIILKLGIDLLLHTREHRKLA